MSEPAPLLHSALDPVVSHAHRLIELKMDVSPFFDTANLHMQQNGHCEGNQSPEPAPESDQDIKPSDLDCKAQRSSQEEGEFLKPCGAMLSQQQEETSLTSSELYSAFSPDQDKRSHSHPPVSVNTTEDSSIDLLRIVKHKPSAIVFRDYDNIHDKQVVLTDHDDSSSVGESTSSTAEEGDDDDFPETSQYKEFLVSRRRRNLSRSRKCLRKRQDAQPSSSASRGQKNSKKEKPGITGSQEEGDTQQYRGEQVRQT